MKQKSPTGRKSSQSKETIEGLRRENLRLRAALRAAQEEAHKSTILADDNHEAAAALREREQLYRQMFTNQSAVRLLIDPATGAIIDANFAACEFYGYDRPTILRLNITDINTLPAQKISQEMRLGIRGKNFFTFRHRMASGELRDVDVYSSPITIGGRSLLSSIIYDVTERVKAEQALKQLNEQLELRIQDRTLALSRSEETFEKAFRATPDAVWIEDRESRNIIDINDEFLHMTGYRADEVIGSTLAKLDMRVDSDDARLIGCMSGTGSIREFGTRLRMKGSSIRDVIINGETVIIGGRKRYLFVGRDITEWKRAEEYALKNEERLKALVGLLQINTSSVQQFLEMGLEEGIALTESTVGYIYHYNETTRQLTLNNWSKEVKNQCGIERQQTEYKLETTGVWGEVVRQRKPIIVNDFTAHNPLLKGHPEGHIRLKNFLTIPLSVGDSIVAVVGVANKRQDYTQSDAMQLQLLMNSVWGKVELIAAEQQREHLLSELERKNQELLRSNKDLDDFAHIASHDLQEPLRMVSSYTQLLARRYGSQLDADARDFIAFAVDGAARMQELIKSLLSYSRIGREATVPEAVDCNVVVEDVRQNLKLAIEESGAEIISDPLPEIRTHRIQVLQLMQNLVGNAIKFRGKDPPRIRIHAEPEGEYYHFSVEDNGIGIDPEYFDRIFMVFQRLHHREEYEGTGIGLAVCRKIAERLGGRIWVTSEIGSGSTFHFTIPGGI
jgi:PAS domain S-box-containing protein